MKPKVFISYASQDKGLADNAKQELEARGFLPADAEFFDTHELSTKENFRARIKSEMEESATFVLVASESATSSDWINYEAGLADALGKNILVVGTKGAEDSDLFEKLADYTLVDLNEYG